MCLQLGALSVSLYQVVPIPEGEGSHPVAHFCPVLSLFASSSVNISLQRVIIRYNQGNRLAHFCGI